MCVIIVQPSLSAAERIFFAFKGIFWTPTRANTLGLQRMLSDITIQPLRTAEADTGYK